MSCQCSVTMARERQWSGQDDDSTSGQTMKGYRIKMGNNAELRIGRGAKQTR